MKKRQAAEICGDDLRESGTACEAVPASEKQGAARASGKRGKNIFRNENLMLIPRIVCVFIALVFWIYVVNVTSVDSEKTFTKIPIKVEGAETLSASTGFSIYDLSESKVSVTVSGKRQDLLDISEAGFYAYIDVSGLTAGGKHTLPVKLSVPETVSLVSVSPSSIVIYTDENTVKTVPVRVDISAYSMSDRYAFGEIRPSINSVEVSGPATLLSRIEAARADLDLGSAWVSSGFVHNSPITFVDASGLPVDSGYVSCSVASVDVAVTVTMSSEIRLTYGFETGFGQSSVASVTISPSTVTVSGPPEKVSQMGRLSVLSISSTTPAETILDADALAALLPDGVSLVGFDGSVRITVELIPETAPPETTSEPPVTTAPPDDTTEPPEDTADALTGDDSPPADTLSP